MNERQDELNKEYAPEIRTLEDGTKVQRTPTEYQCYHWNRPYEGGTSYNNYYLGCRQPRLRACHEDLGDALANMGTAIRPSGTTLGSKITVDQCMLCHSADDGYEMGNRRTAHYGERNGENFEERGGKCISCQHDGEQQGAELWDVVIRPS
ncbi:MAG: hypothetical protein ACLTMP_08815 [Eggerthella lenta]